MYCRNCGNSIDSQTTACLFCGCPRGTGHFFCGNCGQAMVPGSASCPACGASAAPAMVPIMPPVIPKTKSRTLAGLLALLLGFLGVHSFYLGNVGRGIAQLTATVFTCGIGGFIWGIAEGVLILSGRIESNVHGVPLV